MINEHEQFRYEEDIDYVSEVSKTKDEFLDRSMPKHLIFTRSITTSCLHLTLDKDSRYCDARSIIRSAPQLSSFRLDQPIQHMSGRCDNLDRNGIFVYDYRNFIRQCNDKLE